MPSSPFFFQLESKPPAKCNIYKALAVRSSSHCNSCVPMIKVTLFVRSHTKAADFWILDGPLFRKKKASKYQKIKPLKAQCGICSISGPVRSVINQWHCHFFPWALSQNGSKASWQDNKDSNVLRSRESWNTVWIFCLCCSQIFVFLCVMYKK